jgi:hypothetical protein
LKAIYRQDVLYLPQSDKNSEEYRLSRVLFTKCGTLQQLSSIYLLILSSIRRIQC